MFPPIRVRSSKSGNDGSDNNAGKSSSDKSELVPDEAGPLEVGVAYGLIFQGWLRKIIT